MRAVDTPLLWLMRGVNKASEFDEYNTLTIVGQGFDIPNDLIWHLTFKALFFCLVAFLLGIGFMRLRELPSNAKPKFPPQVDLHRPDGRVALAVVVPESTGGQSQARRRREFPRCLGRHARARQLSQTSIGEIDPAGATMQMVLFGFNGVAVNQLWGQAQEAQKNEDWETLRTVLNQLVKLQPHYFKVWDFQAHNLSYNLSVEFDDYRARYKTGDQRL